LLGLEAKLLMSHVCTFILFLSLVGIPHSYTLHCACFGKPCKKKTKVTQHKEEGEKFA